MKAMASAKLQDSCGKRPCRKAKYRRYEARDRGVRGPEGVVTTLETVDQGTRASPFGRLSTVKARVRKAKL